MENIKKLSILPIVGLLVAGMFQVAMAANPSTSNVFDADKVKAGDKVADMEVISVAPVVNNLPLSEENMQIQFKGATTIKGQFEHINDGLLYGAICMMNVDNESQAKLPKMLQQLDRPSWFCFKNEDFAKAKLGPLGSTGTAEVTIDNYLYVSLPAEVVDSATLVEVINKS